MAEFMSIAQISRLTGLASHTIRFYEKMFPATLNVERTTGGHRVYRPAHLARLNEIIQLVKHRKLSIREAQEIMGETATSLYTETPAVKIAAQENNSAILGEVLQRLDKIIARNDRLNETIGALTPAGGEETKARLIEEIIGYRNETRETIRLCRAFLQRTDEASDGSTIQ